MTLAGDHEGVDERSPSEPAPPPPPPAGADFDRLCLRVQRLMDADRLLPDAGGALLAAAEAARRTVEAGDLGAARRHVAEFARLTEALVRSAGLGPSEGQALREAARRLLDAATG